MTVSFLSPVQRQNQGISPFVGMGAALLIGGMGVLGSATRSIAADKLVFTFGPIGDSVTIEELQRYAETGEVPRTLRPYLRFANADSEAVRAVLTREATISLKFLDRVLNTLPGEYALFQLGTLIHTPTRTANIQALRASLVLSASDDNRISLLEFLEKYPTQDVVIDGVKLLRVARTVTRVKNQVAAKLEDLERRLEGWLAVAQDLLSGLVCDCEAAPTSDSTPSTPAPSTPTPSTPPPSTPTPSPSPESQ